MQHMLTMDTMANVFWFERINEVTVATLVLIRPLHLADVASAATRFRISTLHEHTVKCSVLYNQTFCFSFCSSPPLQKTMWECQNCISFPFFLSLYQMNAISLYSDGAFKYCFTKQGCCFTEDFNFSTFFYFFGSGYLLYIVHTDKLPLLSIGKLHLFYMLHAFLFSISFHKRRSDRAAARPTQSLQKGSTGFLMKCIPFYCGNYRPRLGLLMSKGTGNSRPLH